MGEALRKRRHGTGRSSGQSWYVDDEAPAALVSAAGRLSLARAAELRSMAMTAHSITAAALVRLAERFEDIAAVARSARK